MGADLGLATRLRRAGLPVREVAGWHERSNSSGLAAFDPKGGVMHHTAGHPSKGFPMPSLDVLIHGRADLSGPLCNLGLSLSGVFYVIAAGPANHAGLPDGGSIRGMFGNSSAWGMEIEHDGGHPLPDRLILQAARGWAAIFQKGDIPASQLRQHWEWAPTRKIDLATNCHPSGPDPSNDAFRDLVRREKKRLEPVDFWTVEYLRKSDLKPVTAKIAHPDIWAENHDQVFRRGRVEFRPHHK